MPARATILAVTLAAATGLAGCGSSTRPPPKPTPVKPIPAQKTLNHRHYTTILKTSPPSHRPTAPRTRATVSIRSHDDLLCWNITQLKGIAQPLHAFIDRGHPPSVGTIVIPLATSYRSNGCAGPIAPALLAQIQAHPHGYYITIADATHPAGAIRGQL